MISPLWGLVVLPPMEMGGVGVKHFPSLAKNKIKSVFNQCCDHY